MEMAQDRVQWQALVLAVLNLLVLLPERHDYFQYATDTIPVYILCR